MPDLPDEVDPAELCSFEQPVPLVPIKPLQWSVEKYEVAQLLALSRMNVAAVSAETGVPIHAIRRWKSHPEFQEYMDQLVLESASTLKALRLQVMRKILDARLAFAEDSGNYAALSSKDTLDLLDAMRKETEAQEAQPESNYMKTLEDLLKRTMERQKLPNPTEKLTE